MNTVSKMTRKKALRVLMRAAENDVRGSGMGFRSTSDAWRQEVSQAWSIVFKITEGREPEYFDYHNAGMRQPRP